MKFIKNKSVVYRKENYGALFFNPIKNLVIRVNEIGFEVWSLFDGKNSLEDIIDIISKKYKKNKQKIKKDVQDFLKKILYYELIIPKK